jgi:8-oxo-dGTP diphosphatase
LSITESLMASIKVVCGVIIKDGCVLLCRRKLEKSLGGFWEFPGGKVEHNETKEDSLVRELREELSMEVSNINYLTTSKHSYDEFDITLIAYTCAFVSSNWLMLDHDAFEWVFPEKLLDWELAPADIPVAEFIINGKQLTTA